MYAIKNKTKRGRTFLDTLKSVSHLFHHSRAAFLTGFLATGLLLAGKGATSIHSSVFASTIASGQESTEGEALFSTKIKPVLDGQCLRCHGSSLPRGGLRVDSREALLQGGGRGPAIVPGHPEQSLLIEAVHQTGELKMPRRGKLSDEEIQALTDWVKVGAPWPKAQ
jgi:mono/diheme cytochrome c family protein